MEKRKLNILILAGGVSAEREVSLNSSRAVTASLKNSGHHVRAIDALNGRYLTDTKGNFIAHDHVSDRHDSGAGAVERLPQAQVSTEELIKIREDNIDVVFIGLHGGKGENGSIQAVLEVLGIPFTGSPMAASAIAMNKDISKHLMISLGIPTAEWFTVNAGADIEAIIADVQRQYIQDAQKKPAIPFIVKPVDSGSTVGLSLVESHEQLPDAFRKAAEESNSILIERYVKGREITIAILDGRALPPVEIKPTHALYDYTCKYTKGKSQYFCPADIDPEIAEKLSRDAVLFHNTIGCRGYSRVDFIVAPGGDYICLELNTLPGLTELSLFPMAAREAGISFDELLERLCYLALENS